MPFILNLLDTYADDQLDILTWIKLPRFLSADATLTLTKVNLGTECSTSEKGSNPLCSVLEKTTISHLCISKWHTFLKMWKMRCEWIMGIKLRKANLQQLLMVWNAINWKF